MALDTVKAPPKALPSLPDSLLRIFSDQGNALWNFHDQISAPGPAAQKPAHAQPPLRSPQPHEQHAANTPTKPQGEIRFSVDNAPPGTRIRASATGTAYKLAAGRDVKGDVGSALWGTRFSHEAMAPAVDDGLVCRVPDTYAHASSNPLLDSTGFGGHSLDGLPKVIPSSADRGLPVHHTTQHAKPNASAVQAPSAPAHGGMQKPTASKTADDNPGFWGNLWHGTEFTAGLAYGFVKQTATTVVGMVNAGLDLTVGAPIALWSDIIHEEPPSYVANANRVLRPLGALLDKGWDYARSDHFHPFTDFKNWAWNGIKGRAQDITGKWESGDYFGSGKDTGETASDVVTTAATVWTGGGAALRAVKGAADLEVVGRISSNLRRLRVPPPDVRPPTLDVPPPPDMLPPTAPRTPPSEVPPPTAPEVPPPPRPKVPDAPPKMGPPVKPGTLTGSLKHLEPHEKVIVKDILAAGRDVEVVPKADLKTPDVKVDGVVTEFKTLRNNGPNSLKRNIENALEQSNDQILIDARNVDLKPEDVVPQIKRAEGNVRQNLAGRITVWTRDGPVRY